jgi:hypothetical protein
MKYKFYACVLLLASACTPKESFKFTAPEYDAHIAVLASDDFQGRMPFTEGETKTIAYI